MEMEVNKIYCIDNQIGLRMLPENSIDSCVTDPPYELGFMGKKWDSTGIAYNVELWQEVLRVLKPGGHLLAFGGTRTYHRMACAIEDAGFEIRDCIQWLYGSGFPKSMDISKAIDKAAGAERKVIGKSSRHGGGKPFADGSGGFNTDKNYITAPATDKAKQWDGWGTCLKPANEPIVVARKPISEKTIAENVIKWGTGGLNIDGCMIGTDIVGWGGRPSSGYSGGLDADTSGKPRPVEGRFPANVILDEEAGRMLDEQSGVSKGSDKPRVEKQGDSCKSKYGGLGYNGGRPIGYETPQYGDSGGASRFFYCAKASKRERGEGNNHPTVKPLKLMQYLVRLVTPPNGIVLDPFAGSGTTLIAAQTQGFNYIGFEKETESVQIAKNRLRGIVQQISMI